MASLLQLVNIDRRYLDSDKPLVILDKANFSLEQGQTVALVAPSGAGKSTLLHIAGLLERPNGGDVVLRGHSCSNLSDNDRTAIRRNDIGFVYQFHHLLPEFTALENVMIPQMIAGLKRSEAADRGLKLLTYLRVGHRANIGHPNFPAANSNVWRLPVLLPMLRQFCWQMNRQVILTL